MSTPCFKSQMLLPMLNLPLFSPSLPPNILDVFLLVIFTDCTVPWQNTIKPSFGTLSRRFRIEEVDCKDGDCSKSVSSGAQPFFERRKKVL